MMASVMAWFTQTAAGEWSPVPILSLGALFSICTAAVGYGMVKAKTEGTERGFAEWRKEMREELAEIRRENRESQVEIRRDFIEIRKDFADLRSAVSRIQGGGAQHE